MSEPKETKRYYWLRLRSDFFKRHDVRILEATQNGKDYVLFYLKLLLESISHEGYLRFSKTIPYNAEMLSVITDTNVDVVRSAIKVLQELSLLDVLDDKTIYLTEVNKMIGSETEWAEKKRQQRVKIDGKVVEETIPQLPAPPLEIEEKNDPVDGVGTKKDNVPIERERDKDLDIDLELEKEIDIKTNSKEGKKKGGKKETTTPNPEKHHYGSEYGNVLLTEEEYNDLAKHYKKDYLNYIEQLDLYLETNEKAKKTYKVHKAVILNWMRRDGIKKKIIKKAVFNENGELV